MSASTDDRISLASGRLRRFIFFYVAGTMVTCFGLFVASEFLHLDFPHELMVWLVPGVIPLTFAGLWVALEDPRHALDEPASWPQWAFGGLLLFGVWAGVYFLVGRLTDPTRVRFLPLYLEARITFDTNWTFLYLLLYPIFLLPFFSVKDRSSFQRLVAADLLMFATCSAAFLAVPIAFDRPMLPAEPWTLATWTLNIIRGSDPAWNCMPSEHCAAAMVSALAIWETDKRRGAFALAATFLIGVSTLYTKQHYVVDVLAGYGVAVSVHWVLRWSHLFEPGTEGAVQRAFDRIMR